MRAMKKILPIFAIVMVMLGTAAGQSVAYVSLVCHNIKSGGRARAAADHIADLMALTPQKMLILCQEANNARQYFDLTTDGWHQNWPGSPHEGRGNPIFARDAAAVFLERWQLRMEESWTHKKPKDPRVYTGVKCQLVNHPWVEFVCINVHFPTNRAGNGPARQESVDRLIAESANYPDLPFIICGDFNMSKSNVRSRIANPIGGRLYSNTSVDHIILRDGKNVVFGDTVNVILLGKMGSDHEAIRYNFSFVQVNSGSQVADWELY